MPKTKIRGDQSVFYTFNNISNNPANNPANNDAQGDGDSERPALVLLHGAGGTHLHWPAELRTMESTAVYTPDLPAHGKSDLPGRGSVDEYADDIVAFVESLELANVILCGHSMGGAIAQTIGLRKPAWLRGLVLIGTSSRLPVTPIILDGLLEDFPKTVSFIMRMCWSGPYIQAVRIALAGREMRRIAPEVVHGDFTACNGFNVSDRLNEIDAPTLIISGSDDKMTPVKVGQSLAKKISGAQFTIVPKSGHMMALEYPLEVTEIVEKFVTDF